MPRLQPQWRLSRGSIHIQYPAPGHPEFPAPGHPELAKAAIAAIQQTTALAATDWGLDHGTWSVLRLMFPAADVPLFQASIDYGKPAQYHLALGRELAALRTQGVLIVGSGNIVHNCVPRTARPVRPWKPRNPELPNLTDMSRRCWRSRIPKR